jgi:hypothetical protein
MIIITLLELCARKIAVPPAPIRQLRLGLAHAKIKPGIGGNPDSTPKFCGFRRQLIDATPTLPVTLLAQTACENSYLDANLEESGYLHWTASHGERLALRFSNVVNSTEARMVECRGSGRNFNATLRRSRVSSAL